MLPANAGLLAASVEDFLLARRDLRVIHSFGPWGYVGVVVSENLRRKGIDTLPIVSAFTTSEHESRAKLRGLDPAYGYRQRLYYRVEHLWFRLVLEGYERRAYVGSRLVVVNYESVRQLLLVKWGTGIRLRKMPYSSETAFVHADSSEQQAVPEALSGLRLPGSPLVVAVSRHDPRKGLDILLRALARLRVAGVRFRACLIGGGVLLAAHRRLAAELGVDDVTAILGWVPDPYPYLRQADVFVLPSLEEGSGSPSLIEALQAGVAVVASNVDGIPEDVVDGESALLARPGDPAELADALARALTDTELRKRLAHGGRATFEARFSPDALSEALRGLYVELGVIASLRCC